MLNKNQKNGRDDRSGSSNRANNKSTSTNRSSSTRPNSNTTKKKLFGSADKSSEPYKSDTDKKRAPFSSDRDKAPKSFKNNSGERGESRFKKPGFGSGSENPSKRKRFTPDSKNFGDKKDRNFNDDRRSGSSVNERPHSSENRGFDSREGKKFNEDRRGSSFEGKKFEDRGERKTDGNRKDRSPLGEKSFVPRSPRSGDGDRTGFKRPEAGRSFANGNIPYEKRIARDKPLRERSSADKVRQPAKKAGDNDHLIRLNRYIANAGVCSRRKADELIAAGVVSVNGVVISELGHKVDPSKDVIRYNGETLKRERMTYVLLNKPKDYITTTDDPQDRRTVMHLVDKASKERIYPVGRLDRNTTGLLLMTNDGDLADKLSHPKNSITKIYHAELNKSLTQGDLNKIAFGLELEDGIIKPDQISYVAGGSKREVGIQIHSGKNRIVRRIFEHLGYDVVKLDRVIYGGLTKKDLPRGRWRYLEEKEIIQLKHLI